MATPQTPGSFGENHLDTYRNIGVSKDAVYGWLTGKGMPGHRVGRLWKFLKEEIDEWVPAGGAAAKAVDDDASSGSDEGEEL